MLRLILVSALVAVAYAGAPNKCPWVIGKNPFDGQKMVGDWNVIAATANLGHRCGKVNYMSKDGLHSYRYSGIKSDGKSLKGEIIGQPFSPMKPGNSLAVWKKEDGTFSNTFMEAILATDYEQYAVLVACGNKFDETTQTFERKLKAAILSRKATLSEETLNVLKNVLSSHDIALDTINLVEHKDC